MKLLKAATGAHVRLYRATGGRIGGKQGGVPILLLETVGRKSGKRRTTPLMWLEHDGTPVIVGSRAGSDVTPLWWLNLRDAGEGEIQLRGERRRVRPRLVQGEERAAVWPKLVEVYPDFGVYEQRTDRDIPVIALESA